MARTLALARRRRPREAMQSWGPGGEPGEVPFRLSLSRSLSLSTYVSLSVSVSLCLSVSLSLCSLSLSLSLSLSCSPSLYMETSAFICTYKRTYIYIYTYIDTHSMCMSNVFMYL